MSESLPRPRPPGPCPIASAVEVTDMLADFLNEHVALHPALMATMAADTDRLVAACVTNSCRAADLRLLTRAFRDDMRTAKTLRSSKMQDYTKAVAHWRGQAALRNWLYRTTIWDYKKGPRPPIPTQNFVTYVRDVVSRLDRAQAAAIRPSL
jgi:hypothetical protein